MPAVKEGYLNGSSPDGFTTTVPSRLHSVETGLSLKAFDKLCSQSIRESTYPLASGFISNIPFYDLSAYVSDSEHLVSALQDEWNHILLSGPGVLILRSFYKNDHLIDRVSEAFSSIISTEARNVTNKKGDHFAASGLNSRIWNSFQKHAVIDPTSFTQYYSNPWLQVVSEAWLGPAYQVTAQVNIVHPGGKPQIAHRDYHLGFQTASSCARYPKATQVASQLLTLQGAVAHSDMPLISGPTRFLPFSQQFEAGYMAYRLPEFVEYFNSHWVSAELKKGDAVFFNPALVHAAGQNDSTDIMRSANLLQISSAFGRAMEHIDTLKVIDAIWNNLSQDYKNKGFSAEINAIVAAVAEGYPFPTNLDRRPPAPGGMAPDSQQDVVRKGLENGWTRTEIMEQLRVLRDDGLG